MKCNALEEQPSPAHAATPHYKTPRWLHTCTCSICTAALASPGCGGLCQVCHDESLPTPAEKRIMHRRSAAGSLKNPDVQKFES